MIRDEVNGEIARLVAGDGLIGPAVVSGYWPGKKQQHREMVFADRTTGIITFPYGMVPPRIQRDRFTAVWVVRIAAANGLPEAMARRNELANLVARILAGPDLLAFSTATEEVTDTNPDGDGVLIETREGDDPESGLSLAIAEITCPIETQTTNTE